LVFQVFFFLGIFSIFCYLSLVWLYLTPSIETMMNLKYDWAIFIYLRNIFLTVMIYGTWHIWFYVWKNQDKKFKYNKKWPDKNSKNFLFKNQTYDNIFWSLASGVTIWTIYEVIILWQYSVGNLSILRFNEHPLYFYFIVSNNTFNT